MFILAAAVIYIALMWAGLVAHRRRSSRTALYYKAAAALMFAVLLLHVVTGTWVPVAFDLGALACAILSIRTVRPKQRREVTNQ